MAFGDSEHQFSSTGRRLRDTRRLCVALLSKQSYGNVQMPSIMTAKAARKFVLPICLALATMLALYSLEYEVPQTDEITSKVAEIAEMAKSATLGTHNRPT